MKFKKKSDIMPVSSAVKSDGGRFGDLKTDEPRILTPKCANTLKHIAIIMDGNGRWAKSRLMPRSMGHREGLKTIEIVSKAAKKHGVQYLSFFAFSTENWRRPKREVDSLMSLLKSKLPQVAKQAKEQGSELVFSGDLSAFDQELKEIILKAQTSTKINADNQADRRAVAENLKNNGISVGLDTRKNPLAKKIENSHTNVAGAAEKTKSVINICLNYGGRQEIVNAANLAVAAGKMLTEHDFSRFLYTKDMPDPDLLIRTGGEKRISNFMLFQLAYSEIYFCDKLWPDFNEDDFNAALSDYHKRNRRFGGI